MDDIDEVMESAKNKAVREPLGHFILNPISTLKAPKHQVKQGIKDRIRGLMGAYISLATFVDDEVVLEILENPKKSARVYRKVMKSMSKNEKELQEFLRELTE